MFQPRRSPGANPAIDLVLAVGGGVSSLVHAAASSATEAMSSASRAIER
jgi:hypothetical protein